MHHKLFGYTVSCNVETIKCEWKIKSVSEYKYWYEDRSWKQMSCFNRAGAHIARKQSALECVYLRERTSLIVVCWKLHVSLIVCRLFRTPLQVSKCLLRPSSLLQHYIIFQLGNKICLLLSFLCGCHIPHPPHVRCFYSLIIITVGVFLSAWQANYGRGVYTSTLSCDSHQFFP